jgi:tellurite resistance protein TehA-like permease
MEDWNGLELMGTPLIELGDVAQMIFRIFFNTFMVWLLIHTLYYPKSKRRDYYFTFMLISISIFFLIYLLGGVKLKVGFALGLFAIFGIIRYRTESMPVREMTYLFMIISMSVINALAVTISYAELIIVNGVFLLATWIFESHALMKHLSTKLIQYDRIELIKPDRRAELKADLEARTGLNIEKIEVGGIDFLKDMAMIRISYEPEKNEINNIDDKLKISREEWTNV